MGLTLDEAVDAAMDRIRESAYLTDAVTRKESWQYLLDVAERCLVLAAEIKHEENQAKRSKR